MARPIEMRFGDSDSTMLFFCGARCPGPPEIEVVGGPEPYLWVGDAAGPCYGTLSGKGLRQLRDDITRAIAHRPAHEAAEEG